LSYSPLFDLHEKRRFKQSPGTDKS